MLSVRKMLVLLFLFTLITPVILAAGEIPDFTNYGMMLDSSAIPAPYPEDDCIFPSVIKATNYFSNPLGTYYMYFAPHDGPGLWLAYANSLKGPWTVYRELFNNQTWGMNVSHISSPDACWVSEENKLFLYFHGGNQTTKYAVSTDGINFTYGGVCMNGGDYAHIFKYTIPRYNNKYIMLASHNNSGTRDIRLWYSNDARTWTAQSTPLFTQDTIGQAAVCSPIYIYYNGKHYVWAHGDNTTDLSNLQTNIYSVEVGANFDLSRFVGKVYDREQVYTGNPRVGDPYVFQENGTLYMFASAGERLFQDMYLATAPQPNLAQNKPVTVSSVDAVGLEGPLAVDGNTSTRWASGRTDNEWIYIDLGAQYNVNKVSLNWETAYGKSYKIQVSNNATSWTDVYSTTTGDGGIDTITFTTTSARYVRMLGSLRGTQYGYSLWEFEIYAPSTPTPTPTPSATPTPTPAGTVVKIESENYNSMSGILLETCSDTGGGQDISNCSNGDWAAYNNQNFGTGVSAINLRIASNNSGGTVELRLDSTTGTLIGSKAITSTGGWQVWTTVSVAVSGASGTHTLYFVFKKSDSLGVVNINWFQYTKP
jgi:hypothetical protein